VFILFISYRIMEVKYFVLNYIFLLIFLISFINIVIFNHLTNIPPNTVTAFLVLQIIFQGSVFRFF
jgi:hypothetical protein